MNPGPIRPLTLRQPPVIGFGAGCVSDAPAWITSRGIRNVGIVTSPSVAPSANSMAEELRRHGAVVTLIADIPAEPDVEVVETLRNRRELSSVEAIIGCGGGSVLDVAKLLAALHGTSSPVSPFFGSGLLPPRRTALACVPTTAGTGSEVSPNSVLYDSEERLKKAVISPHLVPDAAFVDPVLTVTAPASLTAATGIDALAHCLEAYTGRFAHPIVDLYALEGMRLISANLPRATRNGSDLEARTAVALGSLYGGLCLGPVNTAAVHALSYPLGGEFRLAHGLSNALLLAAVVRFNAPAAPERHAAVARALGVTDEAPGAVLASRAADRLADLCSECGIPRGLASVGVPADAIPRLARSAMKVTRLLKNNPRDVTLADAEEIYRRAM